MNKEDKILIAGPNGLVGSALVRCLEKKGYTNLLTPERSDLDLMDPNAVADWFRENRPDHVFLAAAKVGGILANNTYPAEFIHQNLVIQNNLIHQSYIHNVQKLLFLGSSCIYPKHCPQPMKEEYLMTGPLEPTNSPYAVAKIAGIEMCRAYNRQYGTKFIPVMPTNLYGPNDNFDLETSHVLPALIRKFHLGKCLEHKDWDSIRADLTDRPIKGIDGSAPADDILHALATHGIVSSTPNSALCPLPTVTVWGTGSPKREFLHVDDLADACRFLMNMDFPNEEYKNNPLYNIGTGTDISIRDLAELTRDITGFEGQITFDTSNPDGTPRKLLDVSRMHSLGWEPVVSLDAGIGHIYEWYKTGDGKS